MYILRFHGRDECCQMTVSTSIEMLKRQAVKEMRDAGETAITFKMIGIDTTLIYDSKNNEIGVIGFITEIRK